MQRTRLLDLLCSYVPGDPQDAEHKDRLIAFVAEHEDCFERSLQVGHVTGSAWVVDESGRRVLLTHHKKLNRWIQLGGHADGDADIATVALREAIEESGLSDITPVSNAIFDIDIHTIPARGDEPEHLHYDIRFAFRAFNSDGIVVSSESHDLKWIPLDNLPAIANEPSILRMRKKWLAWLAEEAGETKLS